MDSWIASTSNGESSVSLSQIAVTIECQENGAEHDLLDLAERAHFVFRALGISYFLTYRSLAAAVHIHNPLPRDDVLELGIISSTNAYSLLELRRAFALHQVNVDYDSRAGAITLRKGEAYAVCYEYFDFYRTGVHHRTGWNSYYKWLTYRLKYSISPNHLRQPLASVEFGGLNMSAPHNPDELLSQFYSSGGDSFVKRQMSKCKAGSVH